MLAFYLLVRCERAAPTVYRGINLAIASIAAVERECAVVVVLQPSLVSRIGVYPDNVYFCEYCCQINAKMGLEQQGTLPSKVAALILMRNFVQGLEFLELVSGTLS